MIMFFDVGIMKPKRKDAVKEEEEEEKVSKNMDDRCLVVVELNPFARTTGASLFDWRGDHEILHGVPKTEQPQSEIKTLVGGKSEEKGDERDHQKALPSSGTSIEFRVRREPFPSLDEFVNSYLEPQIASASEEPYFQFLEKVKTKWAEEDKQEKEKEKRKREREARKETDSGRCIVA